MANIGFAGLLIARKLGIAPGAFIGGATMLSCALL